MGIVTFMTVIPDRLQVIDSQERNPTSVALVSMLSLDGPEGMWYSANYIAAAKKLAVSFRNFSAVDMVLLVIDDWNLISASTILDLQNVGWMIKIVPGLSPPSQGWFVNRYYNSKMFSKLHLWDLTSYKLVFYVDLDMLFVGDPASLLETQDGTGQRVENNRSCALSMVPDLGKNDYFNAGVILLVPSLPEFDRLMQGLTTYQNKSELAEQGYLNTYYQGRICTLPRIFNTQVSNDPSDGAINDERYRQNGFMLPSGEQIVLIHYIGDNKPWDLQRCSSEGFNLLCSFWSKASDTE